MPGWVTAAARKALSRSLPQRRILPSAPIVPKTRTLGANTALFDTIVLKTGTIGALCSALFSLKLDIAVFPLKIVVPCNQKRDLPVSPLKIQPVRKTVVVYE